MPHKLSSKMAAADAVACNSLLHIPHNISISYLPNNQNIQDRILKKALNYFTQGYIHKIKIFDDSSPKVTVTAKCWRSMRKSEKPHSIHIEIHETDQNITDSYCTCTVGLTGHCSHILGLIKLLQGFKLHNFIEIPDQLSCTSIPQQWHVPRGNKILPCPINHVVVAKPTEARKRKPVLCHLQVQKELPKVSEEDILNLKRAVGTPLEYVLSIKRPMVTTTLGDVQLGSVLSYQTRDLLTVEPVTASGCGDLCVTNTVPVKLPEIFKHLALEYNVQCPEQLELSTRSQSESSQWYNARQHRLTASVFGDIINRKSAPNEKLLNRLFCNKTYNIHAPSLAYGKRNESKVKAKYLAQYPSRHIHECGFIVNNEFPFLGATPDGKVCDNGKTGLIEIKCPYSVRDMTICDACEKKDFYLQKSGEEIKLNRKHQYYMQVQGQLMISGCGFCDFVVYTQCETVLFVERILPDTDYMQTMLYKLSDFFSKFAHPFIKSISS